MRRRTSIGQPDEVRDGRKRALRLLHGGRRRRSCVLVVVGVLVVVMVRYYRRHTSLAW